MRSNISLCSDGGFRGSGMSCHGCWCSTNILSIPVRVPQPLSSALFLPLAELSLAFLDSHTHIIYRLRRETEEEGGEINGDKSLVVFMLFHPEIQVNRRMVTLLYSSRAVMSVYFIGKTAVYRDNSHKEHKLPRRFFRSRQDNNSITLCVPSYVWWVYTLHPRTYIHIVHTLHTNPCAHIQPTQPASQPLTNHATTTIHTYPYSISIDLHARTYTTAAVESGRGKPEANKTKKEKKLGLTRSLS
jgi:hypothetical protein